jgi:hypothetical protein
MRKADFLKPAFLKIVQFLGDLAFIKRYWILKRSLTWVSEGPGQVNKSTIRSMLVFRSLFLSTRVRYTHQIHILCQTEVY